MYKSVLSNPIGICFILIALAISIYGIDCIPGSEIVSELKNRTPAEDGKIHVTYGFFELNISDDSKNAF